MSQQHQILYKDWTQLSKFLDVKAFSKVFVLVDENTTKNCLPLLEEYLELEFTSIQIQSGERNKTLETCQLVWDQLMKHGADRHSLMINLGGGVIGDLGGFCARTYMRGMAFIQIPTTLLSQVDASVGGKLGIDYRGKKNFIGLIHDPLLVFIEDDFLQSLPENQLRSGYAEVLKHGIIADKKYWDKHKHALQAVDTGNYLEIIKGSVQIKRKVTQKDPTEKGLRKILNFGHTIGHSIESLNLNSEAFLLHGEAIAIGMVCESAIAYHKDRISLDQLEEITHSICGIFGHHPIYVRAIDKIYNGMLSDKKNRNGKILCALPTDIGACSFDNEIDIEDLKAGLAYYENVSQYIK